MSKLLLHQNDDEVAAIGPILNPDHTEKNPSYYQPKPGDMTTLVIKKSELNPDDHPSAKTYTGTLVEDQAALGQWYATFTIPRADLPKIDRLFGRCRVIDSLGNQQTVWGDDIDVDPGRRAQRASAATAPVLNLTGAAGLDITRFLAPARVEGTTDDTAALTAALAALPAAGGTILLGTTHLHLFTLFDITKPVRFVAAGRALGVIELHGTKLLRCSADDVHFDGVWLKGRGVLGDKLFDNTKTVAGNHKGWRFHRCKVTGASLACTAIGRIETNGLPAAAGSDHAADVQVTDTEVTGVLAAYSVEMGGIDGLLIDGCHVHDSGSDTTNGEGIKLVASTRNFRVVNNHIHHNTRDGIDVYDSLGGLVANNDVHDNGVWGIEGKWAATDGHETDRFIITGNRVTGNPAGGINVPVDRVIVANNITTGNGGNGIRFSGSADTNAPSVEPVIANNISTDNTGDGIGLTVGTGGIVTGNQTHRNANGITLGTATTGFVLSDNQAFGNTARGISVFGTAHQLGTNRTQDADGLAFVDATATFVLRNGYGEQAAGAGAQPTLASWPFGAVVKNTSDGTVWRRLAASWEPVVAASSLPQNLPATIDPNLGVSSITMPVNVTRYYRVKEGGTISKIGLEVVVSSGNVGVGVYANTGVGKNAAPGARKGTSGLVPCPAVGYAELALGGSVAVAPGDWLAYTVDNITVAVRSAGGTPAVTALSNGWAWAGAGNLPDPPGALSSITGRLPVLLGQT